MGAVIGAGAQELLAATGGNGSPSGSPSEASAAVTPAPRDPGRVVLVGDSLTIQAGMHGSVAGEPPDLEVAAGMGWTAADAQTGLGALAAARPVDTLVLALGTNDSGQEEPGTDGWSAADLDHFRQLITTAPPAACVVLVLPGHGPQIGEAYTAEMDEARTALELLAHERRQQAGTGPTVVVDWQEVLDAQPDLLSDDGIHLSGDPGGEPGTASDRSAAARMDLYWDGVAGCQTGAGTPDGGAEGAAASLD